MAPDPNSPIRHFRADSPFCKSESAWVVQTHGRLHDFTKLRRAFRHTFCANRPRDVPKINYFRRQVARFDTMGVTSGTHGAGRSCVSRRQAKSLLAYTPPLCSALYSALTCHILHCVGCSRQSAASPLGRASRHPAQCIQIYVVIGPRYRPTLTDCCLPRNVKLGGNIICEYTAVIIQSHLRPEFECSIAKHDVTVQYISYLTNTDTGRCLPQHVACAE